MKRIRTISKRPWEYLAVFLIIFFVFATFLFIIDFVPEPKKASTEVSGPSEPTAVIVDITTIAAGPVEDEPEKEPEVALAANAVSTPVLNIAQATPTGIAEVPTRVVVMKVGVDTPVSSPASADIETLDSALLAGAARYPQSAFLNESGDMLLFGHQSYLPVVHNKAFKAFNDLQELEEGDQIIVYSSTSKYYYRVKSVELARASDGKVSLTVGEPGLTLVTCNSLGAKEDRYIIKADFVSKVSLDS